MIEAEAALPEKRRTKRVRFSEKNDVHVFEANLTDTNSGINAAQTGVSTDEAGFGATDTASEDDVEIDQEHEKEGYAVFQKIAKISEWTSCDDTGNVNFEPSDDDQEPFLQEPMVYSDPPRVGSPIAHAWGGACPRAYRQSAAFAYQRGPSLPRCSIISDVMSPDGSGPLAGMPEYYSKSVREELMEYDELTPRSAQQHSGGAVHDGVFPGGDSVATSPTDCMDTDVSSPKYGGQRCSIGPANSGEQQQEVVSRACTPEIREDSWSWGPGQEDTHERLKDITGATNVTSAVESAQGDGDRPGWRPTRRRMVSDGPHNSMQRNRPALAPRSNQERMSVANTSDTGHGHNENQTDNLLEGEIHVDSTFVKPRNLTDDQNGATARLLQFDVQDESMGDQLLNLEAEQVYDADYLLKSMGMPVEQMSASRKTAGSGEVSPETPAVPLPNKELTGTTRGHPSGIGSSNAKTAPLVTPTKKADGGHDSHRHKSPGGQLGNKRHRGPPSSPLRQVSRLRTTTPKSPFPTTGTPLHTIKEESGSPVRPPKQSRRASVSPDRQTPLRILPFMCSAAEQHTIDEDEMYQLSAGGELLQRTPPAQAQTPFTSAMGRQIPVSPGRTPLSPLAAVSTHAFMQLTGMQHEIDACKLPSTPARAVLNMQSLENLVDHQNAGDRVASSQGVYGPLLSRAVDQAFSGAIQQLWHHLGPAQQQMLDVLKGIEQAAAQNPPSVYHSFKYASSDEQSAILRNMSEHLTCAKTDADEMITNMITTCQSTGREKVMEADLQTKSLLPAIRDAQQALGANISLVNETCDAMGELRKQLTELSQDQHHRCTAAQTEVETYHSLETKVNSKLQHTQDVIEELEVEVESKRAALERIRNDHETRMQDLQAAEAERLKHENTREKLVFVCDETGCLLKKTRTYVWNGQECTEVIWEVTERVMCILRFTEASPSPAVFLRFHGCRSAENMQLKLLLESCLELDPTDGRCEMAEERVNGPPSRTLKWCKAAVVHLEALALEVARLPMNVHMAIASDVAVGGKIHITFLCIASNVEVSLTFAVAVGAETVDEGLLKVNLEGFRHSTQKPSIAEVVEHRLSSFMQPGDGTKFITNACLDLRSTVLSHSIAAN